MPTPEVFADLHSLNSQPRSLFARLQSYEDGAISFYHPCLQELSNLLAAGQHCIRGFDSHAELPQDFAQEVNAYRHLLLQMQRLLPHIYTVMLGRKASLEQDCSRLESLRAWTAMNKTTL